MKLTIMSAWSPRLSRLKRWYWSTLSRELPSILLSLGLWLAVLGGLGRPARCRRVLGGGSARPLLLLELAFFGSLRLLQLAAHLQRARQPQQRVGAADHERGHEQAGHAPKGPEQPRVLLRVVVRGVAQVAGEAAARARVALLTGRDDVLAREVRARVGDTLDVVSAVAVVALGRLGVAELAHLAVVGVEVGLRDLDVAAAALLHDVQLEAIGVGARDRVRAVAVVADRQLLVGLALERMVDALLELLLDPVVATAAGLRHVRAVDARGRVGSRQDAVRGVAAGAGGGDGQAALQQALAVDALGVGLDDLVLRPLVAHRRLLALAVAARTQPRHVGGEARRAGLEAPERAV